jgi:ABC-type dipeptide/oligopeptide/nickel transport system ATPase component
MRQRVAIAMAALMRPRVLIADEPTTALDATLEVQIIELLKEIQREIGCAILFISHHLGVIAELCDRVVVMYAGVAVEEGPVADVFLRPGHPYTIKLIECDPGRLKERVADLPSIPGSLPDLTDPPGLHLPRPLRPRDRDLRHPPRARPSAPATGPPATIPGREFMMLVMRPAKGKASAGDG